jgi:hypothetical protein
MDFPGHDLVLRSESARGRTCTYLTKMRSHLSLPTDYVMRLRIAKSLREDNVSERYVLQFRCVTLREQVGVTLKCTTPRCMHAWLVIRVPYFIGSVTTPCSFTEFTHHVTSHDRHIYTNKSAIFAINCTVSTVMIIL